MNWNTAILVMVVVFAIVIISSLDVVSRDEIKIIAVITAAFVVMQILLSVGWIA